LSEMSKLLSSLGLGRRKTDSPKTGLSPGGPTPGRHEVPPHEMAHSRNNQENIMFEGGSRDPSFITRENITRSPVVRPIVPAVMPPAHLSPQDAQNWIFTQSLEAQYEYHVYQHEKYIADARAQQVIPDPMHPHHPPLPSLIQTSLQSVMAWFGWPSSQESRDGRRAPGL
jgi:hypothetical protein